MAQYAEIFCVVPLSFYFLTSAEAEGYTVKLLWPDCLGSNPCFAPCKLCYLGQIA